MSASQRDDVSWPFLGLALVLAAAVAIGYVVYPATLGVDRQLAVAYGGLLVAFALAYSYRPLRESGIGQLLSAAFLMLFALFHYQQTGRAPVLTLGLFGIALLAFCHELYKFGSGVWRGAAS
ncbi:hypothetical protein [Halorientalis marina]|jgi:hypothetical protein|uniref:hypothetical protein n=1 Tax=Halorientalis marina TaxID=2931976 RepID=UPI001FF45794|nr:hypothetical protein [Halorientalis marina]